MHISTTPDVASACPTMVVIQTGLMVLHVTTTLVFDHHSVLNVQDLMILTAGAMILKREAIATILTSGMG